MAQIEPALVCHHYRVANGCDLATIVVVQGEIEHLAFPQRKARLSALIIDDLSVSNEASL
jgi:hypothetical protein